MCKTLTNFQCDVSGELRFTWGKNEFNDSGIGAGHACVTHGLRNQKNEIVLVSRRVICLILLQSIRKL